MPTLKRPARRIQKNKPKPKGVRKPTKRKRLTKAEIRKAEIAMGCEAPSRYDGWHKHKCPNCNKIWEHGDNCGGIDAAHKCPKCGTPQWKRYRGRINNNDPLGALLAFFF